MSLLDNLFKKKGDLYEFKGAILLGLQQVLGEEVGEDRDKSRVIPKEDFPKILENLKGAKAKQFRTVVSNHSGVSDMGEARSIIRELKEYFKQTPNFLMFNGKPMFEYKGRPMTSNDLEEDFDIGQVKILSLTKKGRENLETLSKTPAISEKVRRGLLKLSGISKPTKPTSKKPRIKTKKFTITVEDKDVFFGGTPDITPEKIKSAYKYWEGKEKKIDGLINKLEQFEGDLLSQLELRQSKLEFSKGEQPFTKEKLNFKDIKGEEDEDIVEYLKFVTKNKNYDYLRYIVDFPEVEVPIGDLDSRVEEFVKNYLVTFNILAIATGTTFGGYSANTTKETLAGNLTNVESVARRDSKGEVVTDKEGKKVFDVTETEISADLLPENVREQEQEFAQANVATQLDANISTEAMKDLAREYAEMNIDRMASDVLEEQGFDIDPDEMLLDPLSVLALSRQIEDFITDIDVDFFKELAKDVMQDWKSFFEERSIPFSDEDVQNFEEYLENLETYEESLSGMLPLNFVNDPIIAEYFDGEEDISKSEASEKNEKINRFMVLFQNAIEVKNTVFSGRVSFSGTGKADSKEVDMTRYGRFESGSGKMEGEPNLKKIDNLEDIIEDIESLFLEPQLASERFGLDLGFEDNESIDIISTYSGSGVFDTTKKLMENSAERGTEMFSVSSLEKLADSLQMINEGFSDMEKALPKFKTLARVLTKMYGVRRGDKLYNEIYDDIAGLIGSYGSNIKEFNGRDVEEEYQKTQNRNLRDIYPLKSLVRFLDRSEKLMSTSKEAGQYVNKIKKALRGSRKDDRGLRKSVADKLLEVHDTLRILKGEPIYKGSHDLEDYDSMDRAILKIYNKFNLDVSASEVTAIVDDIDSYDSISKAYGISPEQVYYIKANFR